MASFCRGFTVKYFALDEASKQFGTQINEVDAGETIHITLGGIAVAVILSYNAFEALGKSP